MPRIVLQFHEAELLLLLPQRGSNNHHQLIVIIRYGNTIPVFFFLSSISCYLEGERRRQT